MILKEKRGTVQAFWGAGGQRFAILEIEER